MRSRFHLGGAFTRSLALICLAVSLIDLALLLGVTASGPSPIATMGATGFFVTAAFALGKTFSAVGLWISSSWGAALLAMTVAAELVFAMFGIGGVDIDLFGFVVRLLLLLGAVALLALAQIRAMELIHD